MTIDISFMLQRTHLIGTQMVTRLGSTGLTYLDILDTSFIIFLSSFLVAHGSHRKISKSNRL